MNNFYHSNIGKIYAPYACNPEQSKGRAYGESECNSRTVFQRDRDRIIHSTAFRRLEYKTQVFVNHEGDHYRTRLTHSLEVAQLARSMSRILGLDEDLSEALALAHDLGHTPFGHAGEDGLQEVMTDYGGFDHNAQGLRILTKLEQRYADFDGLNLSWETLEGVAKHNGPLIKKGGSLAGVAWAISQYNQDHDLRLDSYPSLEAQISAIADDIAYNNHDMEDGIRAGLFSLDELKEIDLINDVIIEVDKKYKNLDEKKRVHEVIRRVINRLVVDVIEACKNNIEQCSINKIEDVRGANLYLAHFSKDIELSHRKLKSFLMDRMYRHYKVNRETSKARRVVRELFQFFMAEPECLPEEWYLRFKNSSGDIGGARVISDFISGMTDRFAIIEHMRIFDMWHNKSLM